MSMLDRTNRRLSNMSAMMERLGIDPVDIALYNHGQSLAVTIRACQFCRHGEACSEWLEREAATLQQAPAYCPNAEIFAQLKKQTMQDCLPARPRLSIAAHGD
jgi:hypothetical protein